MGSGVTAIYVDMFRFPVLAYHLAPYRIGQALAVALVGAVLGALGAVRRVAALPPAEAMRPEAPAAYSRTLLERIGLGRFLSAPSRMILRNLSRKPLRTAVGVFGIAIGGALIILGASLRDAVWALMDEQFALLQRQDATTLEPILLPEQGLVLSTALAELLDVHPGDVVTVEVLEGARPVRQVPVVRLIDQHMGTAAYLRLDAVQRLVGRDRALSGAALQVEPSRSDALFRRLKEMPRVAAVSRKAAFIESFRTNFAANLEIVVTFTTLFATIIAIGVVYNTARISLAERAWELASLRVLGFRRSEISYIFLGELAVVTVLSLPFVFLLGYGLAVFAMQSFTTELYRFPVALTHQSFARAGLTVILASLASGLVVRRQLDRLDLIAVLKTRE